MWRLVNDFYDQLFEHWLVDRALSHARLAIFEPDQPDWTYPVLFMRLPQGRLFDPTESERE
jgi:hypothetical protein